MKQRPHTLEQAVRKLAESDKRLTGGKDLVEVCRHLEIAESTWHRWKGQFGGIKANGAKHLRELSAYALICWNKFRLICWSALLQISSWASCPTRCWDS